MTKKNKINRRNFLEISGLGAMGLIFAQNSFSQTNNKSKKMLLYIGTYTNSGKSQGIYVHQFDSATGKLTPLQTIKDVADPSFLAIKGDKKYLYAVNELVEYEGMKSGAVSAFSIDQTTGNLQLLNKQPSFGDAPCHITVSANQKFVLVANYLGGNVAVYPILSDGKLGEKTDLVQHSGTGPNKERQEAAHAHSITLSPDNRYAYACDLGIDKIMIYQFDDKIGKLTTNKNQAFFQTKAGAGPRHFSFHPSGKFAFVVNELDWSITSFAFDKNLGTLKEIQTVPTLPSGASTAGVTCADIHVSSDGRFVYASNRGHNSIVCYQIDQKTGMLKYVEHTTAQIKRPRNFVIEPNGKFLLVANQDADNVVVFRIDPKTGKLKSTGISAQVPVPVCLKFLS